VARIRELDRGSKRSGGERGAVPSKWRKTSNPVVFCSYFIIFSEKDIK
jgi:hypothetical protein